MKAGKKVDYHDIDPQYPIQTSLAPDPGLCPERGGKTSEAWMERTV